MSHDMKETRNQYVGKSNVSLKYDTISIMNMENYNMQKIYKLNANGIHHNAHSLIINNQYHIFGGIKNKTH